MWVSFHKGPDDWEHDADRKQKVQESVLNINLEGKINNLALVFNHFESYREWDTL